MKHLVKIISFVLALGMLLMAAGCGGAGGPHSAKTEVNDFVFDASSVKPQPMKPEDVTNLTDFQKVADNGVLELYLNEANTYFACFDKRTGKTWYAVPPDMETDPGANDESRPLSQSTITVDYCWDYKMLSIDNYTSSIAENKFKIDHIDNGFVATYTMEVASTSLSVIPQKMDDARFKKFFIDHKNLTEDDAIRIERYYTFYEEEGQWKFEADERAIDYMLEIMERVGYTKKELDKDNKKFGIKGDDDKIFFEIPLEISIKGDSLMAQIDADKMKFNKKIPPAHISVLRTFGSAKSADAGYIMVPDGSGELAVYNEKFTRPGMYVGRVYGLDLTLPLLYKPENLYNINLPVFGQKVKDDAFFAVIEDGDALASINLVRAGQMNSYNSVYVGFSTAEVMQTAIGGVDNQHSVYVNVGSKKPYKGKIRLRYTMLNKKDADYSGMARCYNKYLKDTKNLGSKKSRVSLNLNILGAIPKEKSVLGFKYTGIEKLTTFEQAGLILNELKSEAPVMNIKYSGWYNNGLTPYSPKKFNVIRSLGGKSGLKKFNKLAKDNKFNVYYDVTMLDIPTGSKYFHSYSDAAKTLDNGFAHLYKYSMISKFKERYNLIPGLEYVDMLGGKMIKNSKKLDIEHFSFEDLAGELYSDFTCKGNENRQAARNVYLYQLQQFNKEMPGAIKNTANAYSVFPGDIITNAPLVSDNVKVFDETIPFYSMVFHGMVEYTGQPLNYAEDLKFEILKHIETGASPYFSVMYSDSSVVKNTMFTYLYTNNYDLWKDRIIDTYKEISTVLSQVDGESIVNHKKVSEGVFATEYSNGKVITVDYNKMTYKIADK